MVGRKFAASVILKQKDKQSYESILEFIKRYIDSHDDNVVEYSFIDDMGELIIPKTPLKIYAKKSKVCFTITTKSKSKYVSYIRIDGQDKYEDFIKDFVKYTLDSIGGDVVWESSIQ